MSNSAHLPASLITPQDALAAREYMSSLVATRRSGVAASDTLSLPADTAAWVAGLTKADTIQAYEAAQKQLDALLDASPILEIDVAARLSVATLQTITQWLRESIHDGVLVRQRVDRNLLGGVRVRTGRAVYDLSVVKALEGSRAVLTELVHAWA